MKLLRQTPNTFKQTQSKPEGLFDQADKEVQNITKADYIRWFKIFAFVDVLLLWVLFSTVLVLKLALKI